MSKIVERVPALAHLAVPVAALLLSSSPSRGQDVSPAPAMGARHDTPVTMTECEGVNDCATWTFLGKQGNGQWPSGEVANLEVASLQGDAVVIQRADSTGATAGLTATYTGTRHGTRVGGEFTSSWPGHWEKESGNWYATIDTAAAGPPPVLHFCAAHCATWYLTSDRRGYTGKTGDPSPEPYGVKIVTFNAQSVVLDRTDPPNQWFPQGLKATISGAVSPGGGSLQDGKITWTFGQGGTYDARITWGRALDTIPGSDGPAPPRPAIVVAPVVCVPWFFTVVCGP